MRARSVLATAGWNATRFPVRRVLALCVCILCGGAQLRADDMARSLTLATWNVENLFDATDDPANPGDDEFTPEGWRTWTAERYSLKLRNLADVMAQINADILCLQEIENRRVLDNLATVLRDEFNLDYPHIMHREGGDHRGIDVAILSRVEPESVRWIVPVKGSRDTLIARFAPDGYPLVVYVNHWKSRWGSQAVATRLRRTQARAVRKDVNALLAREPGTGVLVAGDFNDDCTGPTLCEVFEATTNRRAVLDAPDGALLYNVHGERPREAPGTFYYRHGQTWNTFDAVIVNRALLDGPGWQLAPRGAALVVTPESVDASGIPIPFRLLKDPATKRWTYVTGYSDHLPLRVTLVRPCIRPRVLRSGSEHGAQTRASAGTGAERSSP
jgi:endonuclease/exonuclease/phosphatase family metal-dependent hydrolase